jgi:hypothetical protein
MRQQRVEEADPDLRTLERGDDARPLGVWDRIENLPHGNDLGGKQGGVEMQATIPRVRIWGEADIQKPGVHDALQAEAEAHRDDNRQSDRHRDAVEPPALHVMDPSMITGAAKT